MNKKKIGFLSGIVVLIFLFILVIILVNFKEREVYLSDIKPNYYSVGYYDLYYNKDHNGDSLSLNINGSETKFEKGIYAHAHSTIVYDGLKKYNPKKFSTYLGINKTARNNTVTSIKFLIYFDQELVYESNELNGSSEGIYIELEMKKVNRITLVIDDLGGNGSDHGIWASPILTYRGRRISK